MATAALVLSILALLSGVAALAGLRRRGGGPIAVQQVPVEMPVVIFDASLGSRRCGDKAFRGTADVELIYLPSPKPRAEVKVTLEVRRRDNLSVSLARTDLGVFQNDAQASTTFSGELTNPCADGEFTIVATTAVNVPGGASIVEIERVDVEKLDYTTSMPNFVSTHDGRRFRLELALDPCAAGLALGVRFRGRIGVRNLRANPRNFVTVAGTRQVVEITGEKEDVNQVGSFQVYVRDAAGQCFVGGVQVE